MGFFYNGAWSAALFSAINWSTIPETGLGPLFLTKCPFAYTLCMSPHD
jgi:hypothetical protein